MPSYDASDFHPPAPIALVSLRNPHSQAIISDVSLLLDTGADVTLLPRAAIDQLGVPLLPDQHYELVGFDGSRSFAPVVIVDMIFLRRGFRGRYLLIEEEARSLGSGHSQPCGLAIGWPATAMVGAFAVGCDS